MKYLRRLGGVLLSLGLVWASVTHAVPNVTTGLATGGNNSVTGPPPPMTTGGNSSNTGVVVEGGGQVMGDLNPSLKTCINNTILAMNDPNIQPNASTAKCDEIQRELILVPGADVQPLTGLYNIQGVRCPNGTVPSVSNQCVFEVKAWWKAVCMPNTSWGNTGKCTKAKEFLIDYSVKQVGPTLPGLAPSSEVRSGLNAQRPTAVITMASVALGQSTSSQITCADLYPGNPSMSIQTGVDANGAPICGNPLQGQMCQMETATVNAIGGATTNCSPNVVVVKLQGFTHTVPQCKNFPGTGVLMDPNTGQEVPFTVSGNNVTINNVQINAGNVGNHNGKYICGLPPDSGACPSGWSPLGLWKKYAPNTCDDGTDVNWPCSGSCNSAVVVGSPSAWINGPLPSAPYFRWKKHPPCNCDIAYTSANSPCVASMPRIGCF
jgi:hypothetical protein